MSATGYTPTVKDKLRLLGKSDEEKSSFFDRKEDKQLEKGREITDY